MERTTLTKRLPVKGSREPPSAFTAKGSTLEMVAKTVEASAVIPLSLEETWDLLTGDQMRRAVELFSIAVAVEDYQMRPDGTPQYTMVSKVGPFTMRGISDYFVYERPHRTANRILDSPLGGTFYVTFEPVPEGTRTSLRWKIEPQNTLVGALLPVMRPLLARQLQRDLNTFTKVARNYKRRSAR